MQLVNVVKLKVKPNPTLKLTTQAATKATPQWPKLGPQLSESFHLKVCLEGHVTLPHFRDVNIFIDVTLG